MSRRSPVSRPVDAWCTKTKRRRWFGVNATNDSVWLLSSTKGMVCLRRPPATRSRSQLCQPRSRAWCRSWVLNSTDLENQVGLCMAGSTAMKSRASRWQPNMSVTSSGDSDS